MRFVLRLVLGVLGLAFLLLAVWPASREAMALVAGQHGFIPLGQVWFEIDPPSLNITQAAIQRHVAPWLWEDVVQPLLVLPAWPLLAGFGVLLLLVRPRA